MYILLVAHLDMSKKREIKFLKESGLTFDVQQGFLFSKRVELKKYASVMSCGSVI